MSVKIYKHLIQTNLFNLNQKRKRKDDNKNRKSQNNVHKKKRS
jgi:hypothetical protein